jgi:hypothetical protein
VHSSTGSCPRTRSTLPTCRCGSSPLEEEEWPRRELRLGFDTQARLLEIVVLIFQSSEEMVIHAMPARRQYWDLLP